MYIDFVVYWRVDNDGFFKIVFYNIDKFLNVGVFKVGVKFVCYC